MEESLVQNPEYGLAFFLGSGAGGEVRKMCVRPAKGESNTALF